MTIKIGDKINSKQWPAWNGSRVTSLGKPTGYMPRGRVYASHPEHGVGLFDANDVTVDNGNDLADMAKLASQTVTAKMTRQILDHLKQVGTISNLEAQGIYKCRALPKRISELKAAGHTITSKWDKDKTGQRYKRYFYANVGALKPSA